MNRYNLPCLFYKKMSLLIPLVVANKSLAISKKSTTLSQTVFDMQHPSRAWQKMARIKLLWKKHFSYYWISSTDFSCTVWKSLNFHKVMITYLWRAYERSRNCWQFLRKVSKIHAFDWHIDLRTKLDHTRTWQPRREHNPHCQNSESISCVLNVGLQRQTCEKPNFCIRIQSENMTNSH